MPRNPKTPKTNLTRICAVSRDVVYVAAAPSANSPTAKFGLVTQLYDGEWTMRDFDLAIQAMTLFRDPATGLRMMWFVSQHGDVVDFNAPDMRRNILEEPAVRALEKNYYSRRLAGLRAVGDRLYACGEKGQNFLRDADGSWRPLDAGVFDETQPISPTWPYELLPPGRPIGFDKEAYIAEHLEIRDEYERRKRIVFGNTLLWNLSGLSEDTLYICGNGGVILHGVDGGLARVASPVDEPLTDVRVEAPDKVWICSREGSLLYGDARGGFRRVAQGGGAFNSLALFGGKVWLGGVSGPRGLFVYDGSSLRRVEPPGLTPGIDDVTQIDDCDDALWVLGTKDLLRFDGARWERIAHPLIPSR